MVTVLLKRISQIGLSSCQLYFLAAYYFAPFETSYEEDFATLAPPPPGLPDCRQISRRRKAHTLMVIFFIHRGLSCHHTQADASITCWLCGKKVQRRYERFSKETAGKILFSGVIWNVFSNGVSRETREGWPLLTVETDVNGDSKNTNERNPFLVGSLSLSC
jgi:hypothetical protein